MRPSTRKWLLMLTALALAYAASLRVGPMNELRETHQLILPPLPKKVSSSALLTPMLALGRAPLVDYLWLRATKLKDEGRYFDAYQLAQWICEMQPKFPSVWAFQGWNMAYNISVTHQSAEERWRWVRNGYELIRDKGIPLNPNNTQLYRELAWILFHKVGDLLDEWQGYYKLQFALQMEEVLGPPPEGYERAGRLAGDYYRSYDYKPLADAPQHIEDVLKDTDVAAFAAKMDGFGFDVRQTGVYLGMIDAWKDDKLEVRNVPEGRKADQLVALKSALTDPSSQKARRSLEVYWRAWRVRNELKLDPAKVIEINSTLGLILDYRLPESHALYWSVLGVEKGRGTRLNFDIHKLNTRRLEFFCLQKMFQRGRIAMSRDSKSGEPPLMQPDVRVAKVLFDAFVRDSEQFEKEKHEGPISQNFITGFVGFTRTAILRYHELGMNKEAQEFFDYLKKYYPDPMYERGISGFLEIQFREDKKIYDYRTSLARIEAMIYRGLVHYAYDEDEDAIRFIKRAKDLYDNYQRTVASPRLRFTFTFAQTIEQVAHERAGQMSRPSYETVCRKLKIQPLGEGATIPINLPTSLPAESPEEKAAREKLNAELYKSRS